MHCTEETCVRVCMQCGLPFFYSLEENSFLPCRAGSPNRGLFQLQQNFVPSSALPASHFSACPWCCLCDHPCYLLSFPGPGKQCDSLPEGWHLERLLSSLQGNAGPVRTAHAAQQPPEAAVRRRLRHRFVSINPGRLPRGMQLRQERGAVGWEMRKRMGTRGRKEGACSP